MLSPATGAGKVVRDTNTGDDKPRPYEPAPFLRTASWRALKAASAVRRSELLAFAFALSYG